MVRSDAAAYPFGDTMGPALRRLLGADFELLKEQHHVHRTPSGTERRFCWSVLRRT